MDVKTTKASHNRKSRIISTIVSPAIRLWLRSQLDRVEGLQFELAGSDRQILSGYIPRVSLTANQAVYQGLHLSQIQLEGHDICFNLPQVLRGKPLHLLNPFPLVGQLNLLESDLQASLQAPLLSQALMDLFGPLLGSDSSLEQGEIYWQQVELASSQLVLWGTCKPSESENIPITIRTHLELVTPQQLRLHPLHIQLHPDDPPRAIEGFCLDLGSDVHLLEIALNAEQLLCRGHLKVMP